MHRVHRFLALGVLAGAASLGLALRFSGQALAQPGAPVAAAAAPRMALLDVFLVAERMMNAPDLVQSRKEAESAWGPRLAAIEDAARQIDERLKGMQGGDPQAQPLLQERQAKVQEYQGLLQQRTQSLERSNSDQLLAIYDKIRAAADRVAKDAGYTHVFVTASRERKIETSAVQDTLQQILSRPVLLYPPGDDITQAVMDALGVKAEAANVFDPGAPAANPVPAPPGPETVPPAPAPPGAAPKR
jgi:Skp family chaperone for outer membrane proteins